MKNFLEQVLNGTGINPPAICIDAFNQNFTGAVNIEWFDRGTFFEAIFYKEQLEYIAFFSQSGELIEYRMYLPAEYLPEAIKNQLENRGEIMNAVLRNKGNSIEYEAIIRDNRLIRHLILITDLGKVIEEKQL